MRTAPPRPQGLRLLLSAVVALLCATALVAGVSPAADAAPRPAKPAKVKDVRLKKPTISGNTATLKVRWDRAARARSYKVKFWRVPKSSVRKVRTSSRKYVATGLAQGTTYCSKVRAFNGKRKGKWSRVACATTPRLGTPGRIWVDRQSLQAGGTTALRFQWQAAVGATAYELDYSPGQGVVQRDPKKRTVRLPATGAAVQTASIGGIPSGKNYCFQIRAVNRFGAGLRSSEYCKFTMPSTRGVPASSFPLTVGTYNICANACEWSEGRSTAIADRVASMDLDAVGLQEAPVDATEHAGLVARFDDRGYTEVCQVGDGYGNDWMNQVLLLRDTTYEVVPGTNSGLRFDKTEGVARTHGACWVEAVHRATGKHVVIASVHLIYGGSVAGVNIDDVRRRQSAALLTAIRAQHPMLPVVLAGDFNSQRNRTFDGPLEHFQPLGFHDAFDVAAAYLSPPFRNSYNDWSRTPRIARRWAGHIDRFFLSPGIHVQSWDVNEPTGADGRYTDLLSDHSPVRVRLLLPS